MTMTMMMTLIKMIMTIMTINNPYQAIQCHHHPKHFAQTFIQDKS